jgi:hypothetical protein
MLMRSVPWYLAVYPSIASVQHDGFSETISFEFLNNSPLSRINARETARVLAVFRGLPTPCYGINTSLPTDPRDEMKRWAAGASASG